MQGTPDKTVILHWEECRSDWAEISWRDWVRFRGLGSEGSGSLLAGAEAGEHYFLVCILGDRGELWNVIPHRYIVSADARLVHGFGLDEAELEESSRIEELSAPSTEDLERYERLGAREFSVNLPPMHTFVKILKAMPGIAGAPQSADCWNFLSAIGICRSSTRLN